VQRAHSDSMVSFGGAPPFVPGLDAFGQQGVPHDQ